MGQMSNLLDELADITSMEVNINTNDMDKRISRMMPELGFTKEDNDRLV